jgi:hypothetical protein
MSVARHAGQGSENFVVNAPELFREVAEHEPVGDAGGR